RHDAAGHGRINRGRLRRADGWNVRGWRRRRLHHVDAWRDRTSDRLSPDHQKARVTSQLVVVRRVVPLYAGRMSKSIATVAVALAAAGFLTSCRSTATSPAPASVSPDTWAIVNGK